MTDKENLDSLVAEIERLRGSFEVLSVASPSRETTLENIAKATLCKQILSFIDTMQEEPVSEDLEEEIGKVLTDYYGTRYDDETIAELSAYDIVNIARHFANWQKEKTLKESEDAIQYVKENHSPSEVSDFQNAMNISVMKAFDAGKEKMREQMMKKAVKCTIEGVIRSTRGDFGLAGIKGDYKYGDKVKLLILRNDDEKG